MLICTETKCKICFICRIQLQKKKNGVKNVWKLCPLGGGGGVRRLIGKSILNFYFDYLTTSLKVLLCCICNIGIFKVFVGRWFMNSHYAIPGLYNNDQHVTGPRHLGLRCEGRKGPGERLDYFTLLPSPSVLVTL